ncbi:MAG: L,D-transpeptidase family protein [Ruminococcus sp.]|nr:L,D-transpeptidase family protein [Ruminococcus sp.]
MKKLISVIVAVLILATAVTVGFTVFATEGEGDATQPTEQTVYTPADVTGLAASDVKTDSLGLNWNESEYATKYLVYRSSEYNNGTFGDYKKVASVSGKSNTKFIDTNLKAGRVYKYKVYAYRVKNGVTTNSEPASIVVMTIPAAVEEFTEKASSDSTVTLKWSAAASVSDYLLYRSGQLADGSYSDYKFIKKITDESIRSYKDTKLSSGRFYKYQIIVRRTKAGISKKSDAVTLKVMTDLSAPKDFRNKKATTNSITLAWSKVTRASKYQLYRKPAEGGDYKKITTTSKRSYKDTSVSSGANYTYRLRALRKAGGKTYFSKYVSLSSSTAVSSVSGVKTKSYLRRALMTWNGVSSAAGYDVYMQSGDTYKKKATTTYPRYLSGKLKAGRVYSFAIKAYKNVGGEKVYGATKYVKVKISATAYGNKPSGTWVEVCTETQTLYMYVKNKLYLSTPVVTGNPGGLETTPGYHHVMSKSANTMLRGSSGGYSWNTFVNYWLGFTYDGQGIHDAPWRSAYGGDIYKGNGSHGCVNTPYDKMGKVFSKAFVGMPVIVY